MESVVTDDRYIPVRKLIKENGLFIVKNHKRFSLEAASFIRFLACRFERERLKKWLLSGEKNPDKSFLDIFGVPIETAEKEWLKHLAVALGRPVN